MSIVPTPSPTVIQHTRIQSGDTVLLRVPKGDVRCAKVDTDSTITLGRQGSFYARELIGQPYGLTYEIVDKRLSPIAPRTFEDIEDTDATNELINDGDLVQPLTLEEIEALKRSGAHATDIIRKQIEQHANYALKTEYSKEKYKKRKEDKYSKAFTTIEPTVFNVCEYWFKKDQARIRDIRADTLAQMMNLANVRPGGRYLAVDDASGLVVSAILDRMGGEGRLITICDVDSPPAYPVMVQMNFQTEVVSVLSTLNWSTAQEDYIPILAPTDPPSSQIKSDKQKARLLKRKEVSEALQRTRKELFAGDFEGLIISSEYDPSSILEFLSPYLAGSASIVCQSPNAQILADLQSKMRLMPQYLGPTLTEAWLRRYQVLPGRTHPMMSMPGSGAYLLHATKVFDDPEASSIMLHRNSKGKKASGTGATPSKADMEYTESATSEGVPQRDEDSSMAIES